MHESKLKLAMITGCCGFIGRHTTEVFLKKGYTVYGVDSLTYASDPKVPEFFRKAYPNSFFFKKQDICDLEDIPDCDVIVNIAAESHVSNSIADPTLFLKSNIQGVQNLINLIVLKSKTKTHVPYLLQYSTDEVYGDITEGMFTEKSILNPSNPYSASKAAADLIIKAAARTHGLKYRIIRPTNNYGRFQHQEKLIPFSVLCLQRGLRIPLHDSGEPIRTWLSAEDTATATLAVHEKGQENHIYNITSSFEQKNVDTVKKIINSYFNGDRTKEYQGWEDHVDLGYTRPGQDVRYSISGVKITDHTGWSPTHHFDNDIDSIVSHFKKSKRW